ncbi:MAG: argininosuccinate lyase [Rhodospirillaceae bacterium]
MTSRIWGGRFSGAPSNIMEAINISINFDQRLAKQDIRGSRAHCAMLVAQGILAKDDGTAIMAGLTKIEKDIDAGTFTFRRALEDIHMNIEGHLTELIGEPAGRLHAARSRNDQVATDLRLWVREAIDTLDKQIQALQEAMIKKAEAHSDTIMPGFTHLQAAQPVTFGHHMLAYVEMLGRDRGRLSDARNRMNESPLGAGAMAGTSFTIDRDRTSADLGFNQPMTNSLDAVSDRDFALEFLSNAAITSIHLSRLAEELTIWTSAQFSFVSFTDAFSTGSSMMPQKRNPDAAELVRGKAGSIIGALTGLLIVMKGLPLTYSKDMQEDKEPVFDAFDTLELCLAAMTGMVNDMCVNKDRMYAAAGAGYTTATDLADWLVQAKDVPFREAHHIAGQAVKAAEAQSCGLEDLTEKDLKTIDDRLTREVLSVVTLEASVMSKKSYGGTSPDNVRVQIEAARGRFLKDKVT